MFWWPPLWFVATRAVFNCACAYEFRKFGIRGARCFYFVGALLFRDNVQTHLGGASIWEGASNRDITVLVYKIGMMTSNQGSHRVWRTWKTWKNKIFWKSHGKSWNFEKSSKVMEKSWNLENFTPINHQKFGTDKFCLTSGIIYSL